jgi:uncharacterized membrane protein
MTIMTTEPNASKAPHYVERWSSRILRTGVWISALLMSSGLVLAAFHSFRDVAPERNPSLDQLLVQMRTSFFEPLPLMFAGLVVLMFTPILRVITAIAGFAAERDVRFVIVSSVVLLMLAGEILYSLIR